MLVTVGIQIRKLPRTVFSVLETTQTAFDVCVTPFGMNSVRIRNVDVDLGPITSGVMLVPLSQMQGN